MDASRLQSPIFLLTQLQYYHNSPGDGAEPQQLNQYENLTSPLGFLDLPAELRIMVYECIHPTTQHHSLTRPIIPGGYKHTSRSKLVLPIAILSTCHQIKHEVQPIIAKHFPVLLAQPVRFHVDVASALDLVYKTSPLVACFGVKTPSFVNGRYALTRRSNDPIRRPNVQSRPILLHTATNCNVTEFVNRSLRALTQAKKVPLSVDRPYDVETILSQPVESWNPQFFSIFLNGLDRIAVQARIAVVVKSKVPNLDVQPETSLVGAWKFWQFHYNHVASMPLRSTMRLEDIGENEEIEP